MLILVNNKQAVKDAYDQHGLGRVTKERMIAAPFWEGKAAILNAVGRGTFDIEAVNTSDDAVWVRQEMSKARDTWTAFIEEEPGEAYERIMALETTNE